MIVQKSIYAAAIASLALSAHAQNCESKYLRIPCGSDPGVPTCQVKYQKLAACKEQEREEAELKNRERDRAELEKKRAEVEATELIIRANATLQPHLRRGTDKQSPPSSRAPAPSSRESKTGATGF